MWLVDSPVQGRGSGYALSTLFRPKYAFQPEQIGEVQPIGGTLAKIGNRHTTKKKVS